MISQNALPSVKVDIIRDHIILTYRPFTGSIMAKKLGKRVVLSDYFTPSLREEVDEVVRQCRRKLQKQQDYHRYNAYWYTTQQNPLFKALQKMICNKMGIKVSLHACKTLFQQVEHKRIPIDELLKAVPPLTRAKIYKLAEAVAKKKKMYRYPNAAKDLHDRKLLSRYIRIKYSANIPLDTCWTLLNCASYALSEK